MSTQSGGNFFPDGPTSAAAGVRGLPGDTAGEAASLRDQQLVLAARAGCRTAFNELWNLYSRRVYRTVSNITKNRQDAEDAMQDAFLRAFMALERFEGRSSFYSWLTRIAINSALGILRKRRSRREISINPTCHQEGEISLDEFKSVDRDPEQIYDEHERRERLIEAIHRLPENLREAIHARVAEDHSLKQIACRFNISETAAKARLCRARARLSLITAARYRSRSHNEASDCPGVLPG
jgi:RNA polymerase sigma-70 factor (ECF subfamily)